MALAAVRQRVRVGEKKHTKQYLSVQVSRRGALASAVSK